MFTFQTHNTMLKHLQVMILCNLGQHDWVLPSVDLTIRKIYLLDPFRHDVTWDYRNKQVACLCWFIPSMLHQVRFHDSRGETDEMYTSSKRPFRMSILDERGRVPQ